MLNSVFGLIGNGGGAAGGDYESIQTVSVGSGGSSSVSFTSIPSTYKHLVIRAIARVTGSVTDSNYVCTFNGDTGTNYSQHVLYGTGSSAAAGATLTDPNLAIGRATGASSSANMFGVGITEILEYANTNIYKTVRSLDGHDQNGSGIILFNSGSWRSTAAISSITISAQSGNGNLAQYSHFALYGIKG